MAKVFQTYDDAVSCRLCGATHAPPSDNQWKVCLNCFNAFQYSSGGDMSDDAFTVFVARRLVSVVNRADLKFGRCEVISSSAYGNAGYQCGHMAQTMRDGHNVCNSHAKATKPTYCGEKTINEYDILTERVAERFAEAVRKALL